MMKKLRVAWHPLYIHSLPPGHRFPMEKYDLLPRQLLLEGTLEEQSLFSPGIITHDELSAVHSPDYLKRLINLEISLKEQKVSGFLHNKELIEREQRIVEGTKQCALEAIENGVAMNIAGGTHHAYHDRGEGFCLLNDQAVAADHLIRKGLSGKVLIIDLDVHQGNGTAAIFRDQEEVFTFSMHGRNNYPLRKERSDLDIELEDGTGDKEYLNKLENNLDKAIDMVQPDFVFYQCGVDVLESDKLGRLSLSLEGCKNRDKLVLQKVKQLGIPLVCTMGGGYSKDINHIIEAHSNTFRLAQEIFF